VKIRLLCVGKLRGDALKRVCTDYERRLRRYGGFEVREVKAADAREPARAAVIESERLLRAFESNEEIWVLDERGKETTSVGLAKALTGLENRSVSRLTVVLGGAFGLNNKVKSRGELYSLSRLTFPHELCRAIILEQLYRARTIQRNEPYHHS
jgi:23S rRNA (pseudouridine1915-N3)-methyltransferase